VSSHIPREFLLRKLKGFILEKQIGRAWLLLLSFSSMPSQEPQRFKDGERLEVALNKAGARNPQTLTDD